MESNNLSLAENFQNYFTVELASTSKEKQSVYGIRYRVYCEEFEYEPAELFPDQVEHDEYDDISLHCLITHKSTNIPAACVRLVPAFVDGHDTQLPFEKYCAGSLDTDAINQLGLERKTGCEISRLAVDSLFRKRTGETLTRFGDINLEFSKEEQRTF